MYGLSILEFHVKNAWDAADGGAGASKSGFGGQERSAEGLLVLTAKQKASLQASMLNMLAMGTNEALEEEVYLKEKVSVVLAEMAKRSWPLEWSTLMRDLIGAPIQPESKKGGGGGGFGSGGNGNAPPSSFSAPIAHLGVTQLELVLGFFRILAEELGSPISELPAARRKMMSSALSSLCLDTLFPFLYAQLDYHYGVYQQAKNGYTEEQMVEMLPGGRMGPGKVWLGFAEYASSSSSSSSPLTSIPPLPSSPQQHLALHHSLLSIHAILQLLVAFSEWLKLDIFIGSDASSHSASSRGPPSSSSSSSSSPNIAQVVILFLAEAPFRVRAAEMLLVMISRPRPERDHMMFLFEHMQVMAEAMATVPAEEVMGEVEARGGASFDAPKLAFSRRLSQSLCLLGQVYLDFLNINKPPPHLDIYMALMLDIASHPSLQLSALAAAFWKRFLSQPIFQQQSYFISTCETLLGNMQWAFVKWHYWTSGSDLEDHPNSPSPIVVCPPILHSFRQVDFEDDEETYMAFQAEYRATLTRSIIAPIAQIVPATAISFIQFQWQQCLQVFESLVGVGEPGGNVREDPRHLLGPDVTSALIAMFESVCHLASVVNDMISPSMMGVAMPGDAPAEVRSLFQRGNRSSSSSSSKTGKPSGSSSSKKHKAKNNKSKSEGEGDAGALQDDSQSHETIFSLSLSIISALTDFNSGIDEITSVQIDACRSFLSLFYVNRESLDRLLDRLKSLVIYTGSHPLLLQRVASAQAQFDGGNQEACHAEMTIILSPSRGGEEGNEREENISISRAALTLRKKACTTLISIGKAIPSALVGNMSEIMVTVGEWMTRGMLTPSESILLTDWVASLSNAMEENEQKEFLMNLITPQVEQWQSEVVSEATSSPRALLSFAGAIPRHSQRQRKLLGNNASLSPYDPSLYGDLPQALIPKGPKEAASNRLLFSSLLSSLVAVYRRVHNFSTLRARSSVKAPSKTMEEMYYETDGNALSSRDLAILPNLLRLIACIHQLWSPEVKENYEESAKGVYELNEHLVSSWLRAGSDSSSSSSSGAVADDGTSVTMAATTMMDEEGAATWDEEAGEVSEGRLAAEQMALNRFFSSIRLHAYMLLGAIIQHASPFWTDSPELLHSFAGAVLVNTNEMHPYDMALLLKRVLLPALYSCPPHAYDHLQDVLKALVLRGGELVGQLYRSKAEKERSVAQAVATAASLAKGASSSFASLHSDAFSTPSSHPSLGTHEEIVLDRSVHELLTMVALVVQAAVLRSRSSGYAPETLAAIASSSSSSSAGFGAAAGALKSTYSYSLSNFFVHLLRTGNGASHWLLDCVNAIFNWAESTSTRRMFNILSQLMSALAEAADDRLFVIGPLAASHGSTPRSKRGNGMDGVVYSGTSSASNVSAEAEARLQAALAANPFLPPDDPSTSAYLVTASLPAVLYALHQQSENAGMLVSLARELYSLDPVAASPTLLDIPNVTHAALTKFANDLSHQSTQKGKSGVMRELLEKVAGWDLTPASHSATHTTRILDVPAPLFALHVAKRQQAAKEKQALDDHAQLGLASLFSTP